MDHGIAPCTGLASDPSPRPTVGRRVSSRQVPGFAIAEVVYPAGARVRAHTHDVPGFAIVLAGGYRKRVRGTAHDCMPGTLTFEPPDVVHAESYGGADVRAVLIELSPSGAGRAIDAASVGLSAPFCAMHTAARVLGERVSRELRAPDLASALALESLALELTALAVRSLDVRSTPPAWLRGVRDRIRAECRSDLCVRALATQAGVHPAHLARVFRVHERCSVGEYLRRCRIEWAASELLTSDLSVATIAHATGFYDQSHFCRTFRRVVGTTPSRYRRSDRAARDCRPGE